MRDFLERPKKALKKKANPYGKREPNFMSNLKPA